MTEPHAFLLFCGRAVKLTVRIHLKALQSQLIFCSNASLINRSAWSAMNSGTFRTLLSNFKLSRENRIRSLTCSGNSSLNFFRLLPVLLVSDLTSIGEISVFRIL